MCRLEFDFKKEDFEEVLKKSVELDMNSEKNVSSAEIMSNFLPMAVPVLIIIFIFKFLFNGMIFSSDDIAELILSMVLFLLYFGVIFKSLPTLIKRMFLSRWDSLIQNKLSIKSSVSHIIIEFNKDYIKYCDDIGTERISYSIIDKVRIISDFIEIGYKNGYSIYIPSYAFPEKSGFLECYDFINKIIEEKVEYKFNCINSKYTFSLNEDDIKNFYDYFYSTDLGKSVIRILDKFLLLFISFIFIFICIILLTFMGFKYFIYVSIGCLLCLILIKFTVIKDKMKNNLTKNEISIFKKSRGSHAITIKFKESGIEFFSDKYINYIKYSSVDDIVESNSLIILLKNNVILKNIPTRIFENKEDKEAFVKLLKKNTSLNK